MLVLMRMRASASILIARRAACVLAHPIHPCPALAFPRPRSPVGAALAAVACHLD